MSFKWDRVHVWSCELPDEPGSVAAKLASLAQAGANLEYVFTKRLPNKPGHGVLYVAPVTGPAQMRAAQSAGLHEVDEPVVRRIEGTNEAGLAHHLTQQWAVAGISLQGADDGGSREPLHRLRRLRRRRGRQPCRPDPRRPRLRRLQDLSRHAAGRHSRRNRTASE